MILQKLVQKNTTIFALSFFAIVGGSSFAQGDLRAYEKSITPQNILALVNDERESAKVSTLTENELLTAAAQKKVDDMFAHEYFAHTSPDGVAPWHWFKETGYHYVHAGENLAMDFSRVNDQHRAWMESPTHRFNILSEQYDEIGIAVGSGTLNGKTTTVAVQMFGSRTPEGIVAAEKTSRTPGNWIPSAIAWAVVGITTLLAFVIDVKIYMRRAQLRHSIA